MFFMEPVVVTDAARLIACGVENTPARGLEAYARYLVYGWVVECRCPVRAPWDGPERVVVYPDMSDEGLPDFMEHAMETGGVTTEVLRAVPLAHARKQLQALRIEALKEAGDTPDMPSHLLTVEDWARFAQVYAEAAEAGQRQPLKYLVDMTGLSRNTLSARVRRAREMGLLTRPTKDNLGALTDAARIYLNPVSASQEGNANG
jgi:hypothetical protein